MDNMDGPWGQALISALVTSSAGDGWVRRVIAQRREQVRASAHQALQLPQAIGDLVTSWPHPGP